MKSLKDENKELNDEIAKLTRQVKKLKLRKFYGVVWEQEKQPEKIVQDCQSKVAVLNEIKSKKVITDNEKPINILIEEQRGVRSLQFFSTFSWTLDILSIHTKQLLTSSKCGFLRWVVAMTQNQLLELLTKLQKSL